MQGLEGVKVLELGHLAAAAYASKLMADLGADVIAHAAEAPPGRAEFRRRVLELQSRIYSFEITTRGLLYRKSPQAANSRPLSRYQGIGLRSRKNPPVGPPSGRSASQTGVSAPSSTDFAAFFPPMSVRTHPGWTEFTKMPELLSSSARMRVTAFTAVLVIR